MPKKTANPPKECGLETGVYCLNPTSGRLILRGGATWRKMVRDGVLAGSAKDASATGREELAELPPAKKGHHYEVGKSGTIRVKKNPSRVDPEREVAALQGAAKLSLKQLGLEATPDNLAAMVQRLNSLALEEGAAASGGSAPRPVKISKPVKSAAAQESASSDSESESESDDAVFESTPAPARRGMERTATGRFALRR
jgi:hypothetical protein